jgi:L-asparagine transporter-like permease
MNNKATRRLLWLALIAIVTLAFVWVFIPVWTIQPFKTQTPEGVNLSYTLRSWSQVVTLAALLLALLLVVLLWRGARRWWLKVALVLLLVPVLTVMAVEVNNDVVAYPVRQLAYHHVVEDTVGGLPVVSTY